MRVQHVRLSAHAWPGDGVTQQLAVEVPCLVCWHTVEAVLLLHVCQESVESPLLLLIDIAWLQCWIAETGNDAPVLVGNASRRTHTDMVALSLLRC